MIKQYHYYLVDVLAEKIIGSFFASSDEMAVRVLRNFDTSKAKLTWNDVEVLKDVHSFNEYESVSELRSLSKKDVVEFDLTPVVQMELDLEEVK